jgi:hypothetical protein
MGTPKQFSRLLFVKLLLRRSNRDIRARPLHLR